MRRNPAPVLAIFGGVLAAAFSAQAADYEYSATRQKNLSQIGVTESLHSSVTGQGVGIAIFDSYADYTHVDLAGKTTSYQPYSGTYTEFDFHGTHVSGIAAGLANDRGVVGVAPGSRLYNFLVFDDKNWVAWDNGRKALDSVRALNRTGANIRSVNMSYGPTAKGDVFNPGELNLFAGYKNDFVIVRAAGNDGVNAVYESFTGQASKALSHLLIVGSVDSGNKISSFSNRAGAACISVSKTCATSEKVANFFIVAPGSGILSDYPGQMLATASGTSMAAPHVAGAVALIAEDAAQKNTALTPTQIASIIKTSAKDLGTKGVDAIYGWGLLDVPAALAPVGGTTVVTTPTVKPPAKALPTKKPKKAPKLKRPKFSGRGAGDPALLSGLVVFDAYGRPFETDPATLTSEAAPRTLSRTALSMLGAVSRQETVNADNGEMAVLAWTATGMDGQPTSSLRMVSDEYELSIGMGAPEIFLTELPSNNRAAAPQRFSQIMYSSLGEASAMFDEALAMSFTTRLNDRLDANFFGMTRTSQQEETYDLVLVDENYEAEGESQFAAAGLSYRIADGWSLGGSYGALQEKGTVAGIESAGAFSLGETALTQFWGANLNGQLNDTFSFSTFYTRASIESSGTADSLFDAADGWGGDHYGVVAGVKNLVHDNSILRFSLVKPLQITSGTVSARVPVGRELDGTVNYVRRQSSFDRSALPVEAGIEYLAAMRAGTFGLSFDFVDTNLDGAGEEGFTVGAGAAFAF